MSTNGQINELLPTPFAIVRALDTMFKGFKTTGAGAIGGVDSATDPFTDADATMWGQAFDVILPHAMQPVGGSTNPFTAAQRALVRGAAVATGRATVMGGYIFDGVIAPYDAGQTSDSTATLDATGLAAGVFTATLAAAPTGSWTTIATGGRVVCVSEKGTNNEEWIYCSRNNATQVLTIVQRDMRRTGNTTHAGLTPITMYRIPDACRLWGDVAQTVPVQVGSGNSGTHLLNLELEEVQRYVETIFLGVQAIDPSVDPTEVWDFVLFDTTSWATWISVTNDAWNHAKASAGLETGSQPKFPGWSGRALARLHINAMARARSYSQRKGSKVGLGANCLGSMGFPGGRRSGSFVSDGVAFVDGFRTLDYARVADKVWMEQMFHGTGDVEQGVGATPSNPAVANIYPRTTFRIQMQTLMDLSALGKGGLFQRVSWMPLNSKLSGMNASTFTIDPTGGAGGLPRVTVASGTFKWVGAPSHLHPQPNEPLAPLEVMAWWGHAYDCAPIGSVDVGGTYADLTTPITAGVRTVGDGVSKPQVYLAASLALSKRCFANSWGPFLIATDGRHVFQYRDDNINVPDGWNAFRAACWVDGVLGMVHWPTYRQNQRPTNYFWRTVANVGITNGSNVISFPSGVFTTADVGAIIVGGVSATLNGGATAVASVAGIQSSGVVGGVDTTITQILTATTARISQNATATATIKVGVSPVWDTTGGYQGTTWLEKLKRRFSAPSDFWASADQAALPGFPDVYWRRFTNGGVILCNAGQTDAVGCYTLPGGHTYYQLGNPALADDNSTTYVAGASITVPAAMTLMLGTVA